MYTFFHADMTRALNTGMEIELSPNTLSFFGSGYWRRFKYVGIDDIPSLQGAHGVQNRLIDKAAYREFWLEVFRKDHPEIKELSLKSRFSCFYATESIDDAKRYIARSGFGGSARIFEIKSADSGLKLDMTWLDQEFPRDFRLFGYYYLQYWKGMRIEDDSELAKHEKRGSLIEVLLDRRVQVGELVG